VVEKTVIARAGHEDVINRRTSRSQDAIMVPLAIFALLRGSRVQEAEESGP
jgi:hypothetical protein